MSSQPDPAEVFDRLAEENEARYRETYNSVELGAAIAYRDAASFLRRREEEAEERVND